MTDAKATTPAIHLVVARAQNDVIGRDGGLPWHLPNDLQFFKRQTMGAPIIMGRRTHESIGRILPGRQNVVVTSRPEVVLEGGVAVSSLEAGVAACGAVERVCIIGGASLYEATLPVADVLVLTEVLAAVDGDVRFPTVDEAAWRETLREEHPADDRHAYPYVFRVLERR